MKNRLAAAAVRKPVQIGIMVAIFILVQNHILTIPLIIIGGSALGIIFGKVFCRWMCPMGFMMEIMSGAVGDEKAKAMYQYHKLGCPIAWISGLLNRISLFTVGHKVAKECRSCGVCDKACYVAKLDARYSLYITDKKNPADSYTCSRCLECVDSCPTGRLSYKVRKVALGVRECQEQEI